MNKPTDSFEKDWGVIIRDLAVASALASTAIIATVRPHTNTVNPASSATPNNDAKIVFTNQQGQSLELPTDFKLDLSHYCIYQSANG